MRLLLHRLGFLLWNSCHFIFTKYGISERMHLSTFSKYLLKFSKKGTPGLSRRKNLGWGSRLLRIRTDTVLNETISMAKMVRFTYCWRASNRSERQTEFHGQHLLYHYCGDNITEHTQGFDFICIPTRSETCALGIERLCTFKSITIVCVTYRWGRGRKHETFLKKERHRKIIDSTQLPFFNLYFSVNDDAA